MRNLVLGCAQFGKGYGLYINTPEMPRTQIAEILELAHAEGIKDLDLAQGYEGAVSNLASIALRDRFRVGTKIRYHNTTESRISEMLSLDLVALKLSYFESILIHDWSELNDSEKNSSLIFLNKLKNQGITKQIGISIYEKEELDNINEKIDIVQGPLNFFNTELLSDDQAYKLATNGASFHARSIFHQGTLLNTNALPKKHGNEIDRFHDYLTKHQLTSMQGALSVFDSQKLFTNLVVGVANPSQLFEVSRTPIASLDNFMEDVPQNTSIDLRDPRKWVSP
ncbi:Tas Predicted oxidoreductases (related to aryl-alcohol dehydrogenases) [Candidatus Nanopelagicaceae bacterium]